MAANGTSSDTRSQILQAALKCFADRGFAGTSVQQIVSDARVSKPALYYYFKDKAGLFQALVDQAHDGRYQLMVEAAARRLTVAEKLEEILSSVFDYSVRNSELMRLAFATAFAAPGETPPKLNCREKGRRNFEFIESLIRDGQKALEISSDYSADELTMGIYGQLNSHVMISLLIPDCPLNRTTAKRIVRLFMHGAGVDTPKNGQTRRPRAEQKNHTRKSRLSAKRPK
jgi:AcrR family transcriptional regulator